MPAAKPMAVLFVDIVTAAVTITRYFWCCCQPGFVFSPIPMSSRLEEKSITPSMVFGKCPNSLTKELPKTSPRNILHTPRNTIDPPPRAPKAYCAAKPPAPWHDGIAPTQQPTRFITPTLVATELGDAGKFGNNSLLSAHTDMTELSVVSGSCGTPA